VRCAGNTPRMNPTPAAAAAFRLARCRLRRAHGAKLQPASVEAGFDRMTAKASHQAPATLRCNSNGNRLFGPSKADASPAGITMRKILKIITKRLPSFYIDVPAAARNYRGLRPCFRVRSCCHGAAGRSRSIPCGAPTSSASNPTKLMPPSGTSAGDFLFLGHE
jgi:hypothetical protein